MKGYTIQHSIELLEEEVKNGGGSGGSTTAVKVSYDNMDSGLVAETVQAAIDEIAGKVSDLETPTLFSTDEVQVGVLPDNTPVYEKTYTLTGADVPVNGTPKVVDIGVINLKGIRGFLDLTEEVFPINFYFNDYLNANTRYTKTDHSLNIVANIPDRTCNEATFTITYTKPAATSKKKK